MPDAEIDAMQTMAEILADLEPGAQERVIRWAVERFDVKLSGRNAYKPPGQRPDDESADMPLEPTFAAFVDLLDAVSPRTDVEKALTGGYWLQVVLGRDAWPSQAVNNMLKDTGHGLSNVTASLTKAQNRKPALVRQVSKSGKTAQARKEYKLTSAGVAVVRGAFSGPSREPDDE